eukprot:CAMPEP_0174966650 /NCGR_PEP_ID=MMETSP0004_2-20121128/7142_1 /TAXON_ID=420556 /ORGANISM="Ochromonas sp., Strain CCMP1393" /LENGTH=473 /DNA_ID=CAMNT_0016215687 /DNA_START=23 /DNA_END=1441 /DNA_ORIENTATION=+
MRSVRPAPRVVPPHPPAHLFEPRNEKVDVDHVVEPTEPKETPAQPTTGGFDDDVRREMEKLEADLKSMLAKEKELETASRELDHKMVQQSQGSDGKVGARPAKQEAWEQVNESINPNDWKRKGFPSEFAYMKAMGQLDVKKKSGNQPEQAPTAPKCPGYKLNTKMSPMSARDMEKALISPARRKGGALSHMYDKDDALQKKLAAQQEYNDQLHQQMAEQQHQRGQRQQESRHTMQQQQGQQPPPQQQQRGLAHMYDRDDALQKKLAAQQEYNDQLHQQMAEQQHQRGQRQQESRHTMQQQQGQQPPPQQQQRGLAHMYDRDDALQKKLAAQQEYNDQLHQQMAEQQHQRGQRGEQLRHGRVGGGQQGHQGDLGSGGGEGVGGGIEAHLEGRTPKARHLPQATSHLYEKSEDVRRRAEDKQAYADLLQQQMTEQRRAREQEHEQAQRESLQRRQIRELQLQEQQDQKVHRGFNN